MGNLSLFGNSFSPWGNPSRIKKVLWAILLGINGCIFFGSW